MLTGGTRQGRKTLILEGQVLKLSSESIREGKNHFLIHIPSEIFKVLRNSMNSDKYRYTLLSSIKVIVFKNSQEHDVYLEKEQSETLMKYFRSHVIKLFV